MYGSARLGPLLLTLDFVQIGPTMSIRAFARLEPAAFVYGMSRLGFLPPVLDYAILEPTLLLHALA